MCTTCGESGHVLVPDGEAGPEKVSRHERASAPSLRAQGWVREVRTVRLQRELLV
ncbi:MAG: hypothetical protein K0S65_6690, partial [Labilithrix sp.]|nr:hypothetical protein [Labilithrix sp.]